ncbi:Na+/H+ antiporter NhaA [Sphingomonas sp.]|uniref:Na+/H+ antiporter NhaA n=1 Tax=Sphingomonas sp. TaxID=28214 RepID=UPI001D48F67A|nr:Na+/H+ antiporter NhaA [Sphingomonas sp.]MBX9795414.1 Na+/H+ antiporter NhaA [Sphingomonas sp.]
MRGIISRRGVTSALRAFLAGEAKGGIVLMAAAFAALLLANLPATAPVYAALLHQPLGPVLVPGHGPLTVELWINDGLMALFFLLVGLEIKRELADGELTQPARRRLPVLAAAAGMLAPALVYLAVAGGVPALRAGWAIPAATDIAFAIGVMALLGKRVPAALKLFLTTVAIVDDMGAVAIIALAYSHGLDLAALAAAAGVLALMAAMNAQGVRRLWPYGAAFVLLWWLVLLSGVHATVAGVAAAAFIPFDRTRGAPDAHHSPLHRLEHGLAPWVAYAIVPLFALANAGVVLAGAALGSALVWAIALGLILGKQAGILGAVWLAERWKIARRPGGAGWLQIYGVALLGGIGFTMSLFIGTLAFPDQPALLAQVKLGVLTGSLVSAIAGYAVLRLAAKEE